MRRVVFGARGHVILFAAVVALALLLTPRSARAEEAMRSFAAVYEVQPDGSILVTERIVWDFEDLREKHGIIRALVVTQDCPDDAAEETDPDFVRVYPCKDGFEREYPVEVLSVEDGAGNRMKYEVSTESGVKNVKIGDANRTVQGEQTYVVRYRLERALDAYPNHDELYWNATGLQWAVTIETARVEVRVPGGPGLQVLCYEGVSGSDEQCSATTGPGLAEYTSTQPLYSGWGMTIVAGFPKGTVDVQPPLLHDKPSIDDYFELDVFEVGGAALVGVAGIAGVIALWWRHGRDRAYRSLYYLTNDPTEHTRPLFAKQDIVVEFLPPEGLKPAQMGLILDERADTLDVTATIVDLAVRGHLHITEIPKKGLFGKNDWRLEKRESDDELLPYEKLLYAHLFESGDSVELSDLKNTFADELKKVKDALYADGMAKQWFSSKPETSQLLWFFAGIGIAALGAGLAFVSGITIGRALIGLPLVLVGLLMLAISPSMKRRTATGSEALRRVLGFRLYIVTAEKRMQEFNEQENIFARYLPFAIVFGAVDKWAKAFEQLGDEVVQRSTANWYTGTSAFSVAAFSSDLRGFSSSVSTTISSSPSSSGSGFSGGSSGGGGGGGGGGSW